MEKAGSKVKYSFLYDLQEEEKVVAAIQLFARALIYEMAPSIESIRSNAELLREEGSKVNRQTRLSHIIQQATALRQILDKAQLLSPPLRLKTEYGIEMLDLEETLAEIEKRRKMAATQAVPTFRY